MYSRGMYVGPPGGVNISRCIAASTSRAIFTRNSSHTRRGFACSSAASSRSSPVSPSIHFLIDSSRPKLSLLLPHAISIEFNVDLSDPTAVRRIWIGLRPRVFYYLHFKPVGIGAHDFPFRPRLGQPDRRVVRAARHGPQVNVGSRDTLASNRLHI